MIFKNSKISKIVIAGLLCGIFLPIFITYLFFVTSYKERSAQTMNIITDSVSISAREALWFFSDEWIKIVVESAAKTEKVYSASIYNTKNTLLAHDKDSLPVLNTYEMTVPLMKDGDKLGSLTLVFDMDEINKDIYIDKSNLFVILLFQALVSSFILYFIIRYKVLKPIKKLMIQSKLLSKRELDKEFVWEQRDEMGQLGNRMNKTREILKKIFENLESKVIYDNLTQVYNRNGFETIFDTEIKRYNRYEHPFSMIMFDIDFFKKVNDTYGHLVGDDVLIAICNLIKSQIRESDYLVRWGGEEFLILTPEVDLEGALYLAEKLRVSVEQNQFQTVGNLTISLSVAQIQKNESKNDFLKRIDDLLYNAKGTGRNKISS